MLVDDNHPENERGSTPKRAHVVGSSEVGTVAHDHNYGMKSRPELKRQVDDLVTKATILKKRIDTSQKMTRRLRKKVDTLASVVSELKRKNMINSDCATMLETTFSGVPKEIMMRLLTQQNVQEKSRGIST